MSDNYRFRDVRSGQGPVNIGRGNRAAGRDYRDNRSWQHVDNRGGHYAGRDYYHDQRAYLEGDNYDVQVGQPDPLDAMVSGKGIGRLLAGIGMLVMLAGFGGVGFVIVSFIMKIGPDSAADNPFDATYDGITILPVALVAFVAGALLMAIGTAMAKAARRRHDRRMRQRRRRY
ncbi:MAG TPA: hypothetical protein VGX25_26680 [Actinophytocola sp.]|uniref:hypothetical protein n=1 Tax=Actinophytocola sp. TaxID=1872138 RepID=UPI002DDD66B1|nr:hypothetical protein [Actinophytocola sp.]HEV2782988.1 hypothetical protein [Actinophytocola sp.]